MLIDNNIKYELSTRLVSVSNQIIGSPYVNETTFNLYLNSCSYCKGTGYKAAYDKSLIINDESLSINDVGFFHLNIKLKLKGVINRFEREGLFDFSKCFNDLTEQEKHIFLFGYESFLVTYLYADELVDLIKFFSSQEDIKYDPC